MSPLRLRHHSTVASAALEAVVRCLLRGGWRSAAFTGVSPEAASPIAGLPSPSPAGRSPPVVPVTS